VHATNLFIEKKKRDRPSILYQTAFELMRTPDELSAISSNNLVYIEDFDTLLYILITEFLFKR
jgi:hypothetical protein